MDNLFSCKEVAERYNVSVFTVWDWVKKKKMRAIKIGRTYKIRQEDIQQFESERLTIQERSEK